MKVGAVTETVEVTGGAPLLQTQSTEVSTLFDADTTTSLPLAARNYVQLTLLSPGATHVNPGSLQYPQNMIGAGRPFINGNREQANESPELWCRRSPKEARDALQHFRRHHRRADYEGQALFLRGLPGPAARQRGGHGHAAFHAARARRLLRADLRNRLYQRNL